MTVFKMMSGCTETPFRMLELPHMLTCFCEEQACQNALLERQHVKENGTYPK